jgi:2-dehydropantoate 2-reductase
MSQNHFKKIAVVGAGAVGCYYGGILARHGFDVTLIARPTHADAINKNGLMLESKKLESGAIKVAATTEPTGVSGADLVLFCVKTGDTEATAAQIKTYLDPNATIVLLQNGVDNLRRIKAHIDNPVIPAVVYVASSMGGPGVLVHAGAGTLVIGKPVESAGDDRLNADLLAKTSATFEAGEVGCPVAEDIDSVLWGKLAINCAFNAISAVGQANYATILDTPVSLASMRASIDEVVAVANAANVKLDAEQTFETILRAGNSMRPATSSTAQDLARGKKTEIDELNGFIVRRGEELNVPTPVNQVLHSLVKLREFALDKQD